VSTGCCRPVHPSKDGANIAAERSRPLRGLLPVKVQLPATWCMVAAPGARRKRSTQFVVPADPRADGSLRFPAPGGRAQHADAGRGKVVACAERRISGPHRART
jgi:hypothetical protein